LTYKSFDENSSAQLEGEKERGREREGGGKMEKREMIKEKREMMKERERKRQKERERKRHKERQNERERDRETA